MNSYMISEAKDEFHRIVRQVEESGLPVLVASRGVPDFYIFPVNSLSEGLCAEMGDTETLSFSVSHAGHHLYEISRSLWLSEGCAYLSRRGKKVACMAYPEELSDALYYAMVRTCAEALILEFLRKNPGSCFADVQEGIPRVEEYQLRKALWELVKSELVGREKGGDDYLWRYWKRLES